MKPEVTPFFDDATNTITYVVRDPEGTSCAIIDSVLDFDYASGRSDTSSADAVIAFVQDRRDTGWTGCWKHTSMPTTCPPRPICRKNWAGRSGLAIT